MIRDNALAVSGLLVNQLGGPSVRPYEVAASFKPVDHAKDTGLYRRSLYTYWKRTSPHPMMTLFDAPSRESSCVRRSRTNTPLQSLGLLNETQRIEMARVLSQRLLQSEPDDRQRIDLLFTLLASRRPSPAEFSICKSLLQEMKSRYAAAPDDANRLLSIGEATLAEGISPPDLAAWIQLSSTILASDMAIMMY